MSSLLLSLGYQLRSEPWLQVVWAVLTLWLVVTISQRVRFVALVSSFLALHVLLLAGSWDALHSDGNTLFGIVPISDAQSYYEDAFAFARGEELGQISSRRPLYPVALGLLLKACQGDLRLALVVITMGLDLLLAIFVHTLLKTHRLGIVAVVTSLILIFMNRFVGQAMTEQLGLAGGLMAATMFLRSNRVAAVLFLLIGLLARAGAFAVIPLLLFWHLSSRLTPFRPRIWWSGLLAVVVCTGIYRLLCMVVVDPSIPSFGNASYSLYGVLTGYRGWQAVELDYPLSATMPEHEIAPAILEYTRAAISQEPLRAAWGIARSVIDLPIRLLSFIRLTDPWAPLSAHPVINGLPYAFVTILFLYGLYWLFRYDRSSWHRAFVVGLFLSAPFAPPIDSDAMRVYAATLPLTLLIMALPWRNKELQE